VKHLTGTVLYGWVLASLGGEQVDGKDMGQMVQEMEDGQFRSGRTTLTDSPVFMSHWLQWTSLAAGRHERHWDSAVAWTTEVQIVV
jgi:hypothetical protein